ncbi:MAG: LysR family transcriptional regulator [Gammaproteobacteria bacterium]|nr:MAG: LysR family transcriptional regulator [Gammaproteobacteria bacterium]TND07116.1 MAG: LysR family transcriptional regulator [Gammaproteobacteria bacterium]
MNKLAITSLVRHMSLRQLQVFEAIARHSSFTRAAEELHLTQPTVSAQIKNLTGTVGLPLFEQIGKKIHVTEAGRALQKTCREVFDALSRFEMETADMKGLKHGHLRLAVVTTAKYFVPRALGPFCQRYPGVDVALKVTNRERVLERLMENEDDLYIFGQPPAEIDVEAIPFLRNPLVVIAARDHPLANKRRIPIERIAQEAFLVREPGSGTRLATERRFAEFGLKIPVKMELGSNEAIKQGVAGGLGLSVLSHHTLFMEEQGGLLRVLNVEGFPIERHWYMVYPKGKQLSVVARTFLDYMMTEGKRIAETSANVKSRLRRSRTRGKTERTGRSPTVSRKRRTAR